jgi:hypothetical protein
MRTCAQDVPRMLLTDNHPSPYHDGRASGILYSRPMFVFNGMMKKSSMRHTKPYRNKEGMPVITLMMEKDTPKFFAEGGQLIVTFHLDQHRSNYLKEPEFASCGEVSYSLRSKTFDQTLTSVLVCIPSARAQPHPPHCHRAQALRLPPSPAFQSVQTYR